MVSVNKLNFNAQRETKSLIVLSSSLYCAKPLLKYCLVLDILRRALTLEHLKKYHHGDKESGSCVYRTIGGDVDI